MHSCGESKEVRVVSQSDTAPVENCCFADTCKGGWGTGQEWGNLLPNFFSYKFRNVPSKMWWNCLRCHLRSGFNKGNSDIRKALSPAEGKPHRLQPPSHLSPHPHSGLLSAQWSTGVFSGTSLSLLHSDYFRAPPRSGLQHPPPHRQWDDPTTGAIRQECCRFHGGSQPLLSPLSISSWFLSPHHCPVLSVLSPQLPGTMPSFSCLSAFLWHLPSPFSIKLPTSLC